MVAYYDSYDYSSYWSGREYEHESEVVCLKEFLAKIPKIDRTIEIGGGYGRLVPYYIYRTKLAILTDPSAKLLSLAKQQLATYKNIKYLQATLEHLPEKVQRKSFDLVMMIRVMHHIDNPEKAFEDIEKLVTPGGFFILEFANKIHFKKVLAETLKGNFGFVKQKEEVDVRSEKSKKQKTISFLNYHPGFIKQLLEKHNFEIIETRSVSNVRSPLLKRHLSKEVLVWLEKMLQKPFSYIFFGPSIFILAKKKG